MPHNFPKSQWIWYRITPILFNALQHKSGLLWSQECVFVRKVWDEQPGHDSKDYRDCTLDDLRGLTEEVAHRGRVRDSRISIAIPESPGYHQAS
jgi:hypothetical protein